MRKQYILVENAIRTELLKEYYLRNEIRQIIFEEQERLDEIFGAIRKAIKNWPKIKAKIDKIVSFVEEIKKYTKVFEVIGVVTSNNPGKMVGWLLDKESVAAKLDKGKRIAGKVMARSTEYSFETEFTSRGLFAELEQAKKIKETVSYIVDIIRIVIELCGAVGTILGAIFDVAESILSDICTGVKNVWDIVWHAFNKVLKGLLGFDLYDVKKYAEGTVAVAASAVNALKPETYTAPNDATAVRNLNYRGRQLSRTHSTSRPKNNKKTDKDEINNYEDIIKYVQTHKNDGDWAGFSGGSFSGAGAGSIW